jgi:primosomal protein N' (replication factor Y)
MANKCLSLLPEIALTQPFLQRFEARFGVEPATWHSGMKQSQRRRVWRGVAEGRVQVVAGARSALFLPFANPGLIVVDEAHEISFKQEDGVRYHARDVAVMRGKFEGFPVVLASATPALESRHMVSIGRYKGLAIPSRFGAAKMPRIEAIDLTQDQPERGHWIAPDACSRRWRNGSNAASRACCSSTAAAMRRSPCAAIAGTGSNAPIAPHGWSSTGWSAASPATIAAM